MDRVCVREGLGSLTPTLVAINQSRTVWLVSGWIVKRPRCNGVGGAFFFPTLKNKVMYIQKERNERAEFSTAKQYNRRLQ